MVYCRNQFIGHFRKQNFRIGQELWRFPFQNILSSIMLRPHKTISWLSATYSSDRAGLEWGKINAENRIFVSTNILILLFLSVAYFVHKCLNIVFAGYAHCFCSSGQRQTALCGLFWMKRCLRRFPRSVSGRTEFYPRTINRALILITKENLRLTANGLNYSEAAIIPHRFSILEILSPYPGKYRLSFLRCKCKR